jgi:hypothetical protein
MAVQTGDFEDSPLGIEIGCKPLAARRLRKFKHLGRPFRRFIV